jgi:inorganic pyrophosphatase
MADLTTLPHQLDVKKGNCRAIIETPKGCRNKFDYDPEAKLFMLGGLLPEGMMFPFDFGFIPSTLGEDGDPLDILVLMDAPAHVGCLIEVRLIGVISAEQIEDGDRETNDRLLGVAIHSYDHENLKRSRTSAKQCFHSLKSSSSHTTNNAARSSGSRAQAGRKKPSSF